LAEELRTLLPDLPMICDPSHICGNHALVEHVANEALNRHYRGLMIEVHENPELAMSDGSQQLTPVAFHKMINSLIQKKRKI
jgi:chorismate mutase